ncbi:hypothetical protein NP493_108g04003 [Ridgeia piscesae]|uniref:Uncharacterized protein n=1 Tax=Ridgeia piscesae TaxID=27915 RepID=A0AAD9P798_RIDPI|nr:hypothetical protein NP493_108g04003 [Ridgeia piscesae]
MERWVAKAISLVIIYISILTVTLLPIWVATFFTRHGARGRVILSGISCFSGGIFLAAYLLVMAPEVRALLETSLMIPNRIQYPVPELAIGAGFFFIVTVELIVMKVKSCGRSHSPKTSENGVDAPPNSDGISAGSKMAQTTLELIDVAVDIAEAGDNVHSEGDMTTRDDTARKAEDAIADHGTMNRNPSVQLVIMNGDEPEPEIPVKPTANGTVAVSSLDIKRHATDRNCRGCDR